MRVLLTNDDGINAPGLGVLQQIAAEIADDVWVVAPETDQSGASHSLTLHEPLRCRQVGPKVFAVRGTPTDCVIMGTRHLLADHRPDLVLSGVNRGHNIAEDVTYSGTIAGAIEGTMLGIPSIALSQSINFEEPAANPWDCAITHGAATVKRLLQAGWPANVLININFPNCLGAEVAETVVTSQGKRDQDMLRIEDRLDTRGNPYYWVGFERRRLNPAEGTDLWAMYNRRVSITPLNLNLTDWAVCEALRADLNGWPG